jgi:hypothetical protein
LFTNSFHPTNRSSIETASFPNAILSPFCSVLFWASSCLIELKSGIEPVFFIPPMFVETGFGLSATAGDAETGE